MIAAAARKAWKEAFDGMYQAKYLNRYIAGSNKAKGEIRSLIGGEVLQVKVGTELPVWYCPETTTILARALDVTEQEILKNKLSSGMKASKALAKLAGFSQNDEVLKGTAFSALLYTYTRELEYPVNYNRVSSWTKFIQVYYEYLNKEKQEADIYIDTRFWSFLWAGNVNGELPCYGNAACTYRMQTIRSHADDGGDTNANGCYSAAPFALSQSPGVAMAYTVHPSKERLDSRAWIYFAPDFSGFAVGRPYGQWGEKHNIVLSKTIKKLIAEKIYPLRPFNASSPKWIRKTDFSLAGILHRSPLVYTGDSCQVGYRIATHIAAQYGALEHFRLWDIAIPHYIPCLSCGNMHRNAANAGFCSCTSADENTVCASCGCEISEDGPIWVDGQPYCDDCVAWCVHCQEYHLSEDCQEVNAENGTEYWCKDCIRTDAYECYSCGSLVSEDYCQVYEGDFYCQDCFDEEFEYCDCCQEHRPISGSINVTLDNGVNHICEACIEDGRV